ncbi:MAG: RNA polymerase factor sigma-54, partial [Blastocatellia bacterium]|nr:RNA polymerase factor sigma-54 [Blastocatellia bacterium]
MSFKPTLTTQLSQRLVLTPQLRQRIEMLQMTKLELGELVTQQLGENPVLEEFPPEEVAVSPDLANGDFPESSSNLINGAAEASESPQSGVEPGAVYEAGGGEFSPAPGEGVRESENVETREPEIGERDSFEEIDFGTTFEEYLDPGYRTRETEVKDTPSFEQFLSSEQSLADYLNWQLQLTVTTPEVFEAAEAIIGNMTDDGFLDGTLEEIAAIGPWSKETVEKALETVQQFDPSGVGARDLQECLLLQLKHHGYGDRLAARIIRDYPVSKLQNHKLPELAKELGVGVDQLAQELKLIRQLEPHPGRRFSPRDAQYIEPEVYIEKIEDEYVIRFNDDGLPQLRINKQYRQMMENKETSKETRDYIKDKFRSAVDLLKNIEHRKQTIYKVCERIVERQRDFLDKGVEYLKPMMLKDISEDIGMHLSTVSRVVN